MRSDPKRCSKCREFKPIDSFYRDNRRNGLCSECKSCYDRRVLEYKRKHPEKHRAAQKKYKLSIQVVRRIENKRLLKKYGISLEQFWKMLCEQQGRCAVCLSPSNLQVDHDHNSGVVRGLLCLNCNRAAGLLDDNPELMEALARYLRVERGAGSCPL